jgi:hypothetical protein
MTVFTGSWKTGSSDEVELDLYKTCIPVLPGKIRL